MSQLSAAVFGVASGRRIAVVAGAAVDTVEGVISADAGVTATIDADAMSVSLRCIAKALVRLVAIATGRLADADFPTVLAGICHSLRMAGGGSDGSMKIWNAEDGRLVRELLAHHRDAGAEFSTNG